MNLPKPPTEGREYDFCAAAYESPRVSAYYRAETYVIYTKSVSGITSLVYTGPDWQRAYETGREIAKTLRMGE